MNILSDETCSSPSSGLMIPFTDSPNEKWSIRWEKLYSRKDQNKVLFFQSHRMEEIYTVP